DIYSKCLAYNKCKDPQVFPRELREFHRFMVNKWSVEELDWTIIYSAAGLDSAVYIPNANYLREDEYIEIFKAIINDNELSSLRKLQYTVLLLLCYRFGLRFGEAYRMQWKNIQYDEELQEVNVRVKKGFHGNPKTDAGIRKVSLLTKLTRKEKNTLKQLLDIHEPGFNVDPQQGLMADVGAERFLIDRAHASTYISTLMRHVTGDDSIRLHHLRHSWANEACLKDYKFKGNKIPCDSDLVSKYDVNDSVTLRDASVLIGHSDEGTLLGSYIHKTDRLISKYCETISPKIDARSLQYMANIKYDTARQRLYRGKSKRIDFVKILKLSRLIKQPCVELAKSRPCYVSNIDKGSDLVSLGMVNEILLACAGEMMCNSPRSRIDSIAERFLLNSKFVEVILDKAAHVERKSGYDLFGLGQFNRDLIESNVEKKKWGWRANITGEARARVLLHTVGKHYEGLEVKERDILHEAVNIWQEDYFNVDSDLYITELNAIDTFGKAIDLLGFRGLKLGITVPTELAEKCQPLKERFGERFNIRISNIRYAYKKTQWERKSRLRVSAITKNSDIVTKQTFARLMFCLSVWCLLRPIQ
ncbi:MAG: tyrosine-type recombinase/integrase, partial [Gammaproteobacteria bacterium]|nr:tyrosine-type recombinase/integrase [Gammaproteobacteria bacterium]